MANETTHVAEYAAALRYDDIPADVVERAKHCIADTIASIVFGYQLPWSQIIVAYAERNGAGGSSRDRKSTRLNSSHVKSSYAVFCSKTKKKIMGRSSHLQQPSFFRLSVVDIAK